MITTTLTLCPDCAAAPGEAHDDQCDIAVCLHDGGQRLMHRSDPDTLHQLLGPIALLVPTSHDCGRDIWTGEWPGTADARRHGLWCFWGPDYGRTNVFIPCTEDHPGALPDFNRIMTTCRWNRDTRSWEPRQP